VISSPRTGGPIATAVGTLVLAALALAPAAHADPVPLPPVYGTGAPGGAAGQLNIDSGVAVDAAGDVYAADQQNQRIAVFNAGGTFLRAFGYDVDPGGGTGFEVCTTSCKSGTAGGGAGQLNVPTGIAVDSSGRLFVPEQAGHRISVFTKDGTFLRAFGYDVDPGGGVGFEVCTTSCKAGVLGGGAGQLYAPVGISIGPTGDLYVGDSANHRISVFTPQGAFLRAFGYDVDPGGGVGFEVCTTSCKAGAPGGGAGQLFYPDGVSVDGAGNVYVADHDNNRISAYTGAGTFLRSFGFDVAPGGGSGLELCTTICQAGVAGGAAGQLDQPVGVSVDAGGNLFVADQPNHRVAVFTTQGGFLRAFGHDVIPGGAAGYEVCTTVCQPGVAGTGSGQFTYPFSIAIDCRGAIYVDGNNRIERFGEPATPLPPCPAATPPPSNQFTFGKLKRNRRKGTAKLTVKLPGPGGLTLASKLVKPSSKQVSGAGETKLAIKPKGKAKRRLTKTGKTTLKVIVTFTPTGGDANGMTKTVKLKRKLRP
jgi:sugar lactone lactonase YvrE